MPAVCCREYLAIFKKTVAMHEGFLQRLAAHPTLHRDHNFYVFLEYGQDVRMGRCSSKHALGVQQAPPPQLTPLLHLCASAERPRKEPEGTPWRLSEEYCQVCR